MSFINSIYSLQMDSKHIYLFPLSLFSQTLNRLKLMKKLVFILCIASFFNCNQMKGQHEDPTHNFTVKRLIIINDNNEMLMCKESYVWATPSLVYNERQYITEALDSVANAYGVKIKDIELHGQFSYKYDYHPHATLRNYYVAKYTSGTLKTPKNMDGAQWMPISEAIEKTTVTSIKEITKQIIEFPDVVWGASFMVSRTEGDHPTKMVTPFYPLFKTKE